MAKGMCFVISQIGDDNSDERKQADALLDVIENCCELHDLECIRADRIKGASDINDDIIEHVRTSDLCIVDLTNLNPNVMYEFGIRFQIGRPYIVLANRKTKLPFDTITKRTIFYDDLSMAAESRRIQKEIREYIGIYENSDFQALSRIPSLSNIYSLLEKIHQQLNNAVLPNAFSLKNNSPSYNDELNLEDILSSLDPSEAFHYAYKTNNILLAEEVLKLLKGSQSFELFFNKLCALASRGSIYAAVELKEGLDAIMESGGKKNIIEAIGSLVSNYSRRDVENDYLEEMEKVFVKAITKMDTNKDRASILNQQQRLLAGAGKYDEAKKILEEVVSLNDEEPSYFYNYAIILDYLEDLDGAIQQIKRSIELSDKDSYDDDHLFKACQLLKRSTKTEDRLLYQECLSNLEIANPYKARMVRFQ